MQQAFSSEQVSTLHLAIPALEALHRAWSTQADQPKYECFVAALNAASTKIDEYYEKTTESPAYIMATGISVCLCLNKTLTPFLVLNLKEKMMYFKKHWSSELQDKVVKCVENVVHHTVLFTFF